MGATNSLNEGVVLQRSCISITTYDMTWHLRLTGGDSGGVVKNRMPHPLVNRNV